MPYRSLLHPMFLLSRIHAVYLAVALSVFTMPAEAQDPASLHVRVTAPEGTPLCVDEATLRDALVTRLGYDPFRADTTSALEFDIERDRTGWHAHVTLRHADMVGTTELSGPLQQAVANGQIVLRFLP